jgi:hypothetical protein
MTLDIASLEREIDADAEKVQKALRPAAQAGSQVLYDQVELNVAGIKKKTGNLAQSIYQVYSKRDSTPDRPMYEISWNPRKAPHGYLVENGHIQRFKVYQGKDGNWYINKKAPLAAPRRVAANPFVAPAAAQMPRALQTAEDEFFRRVGE